MSKFLLDIKDENIDLKSLGIKTENKQKLINLLYQCYELDKND